MSVIAHVPKLVVHSVHGTWPYGLWAQLFRRTPRNTTGKELPWFLKGSSFHVTVAALAGRPLEWVPFTWNGKNSFKARRLAAKALSQQLNDWFESEPEAEHVVIAHSHGGSISVAAARMLDGHCRNHLSKIITLATPFAEARPSERDLRELAARYMALRFGWAPLALFVYLVYLMKFRDPHADPESIFVVFLMYVMGMVAVVTPMFFLLWKIGLIKFVASDYQKDFQPISQVWSLYAIRGPGDEANIAISTSQFIGLMSDLLFTRAVLAPFDWLRARLTRDTWKRRLRFWLRLGALMFLVYPGIPIAIAAIDANQRQELVRFVETHPIATIIIMIGQFAGAVIAAPLLTAQLIAVAYAFVTLAGPLILIPANCVLALALGRDVMRYQGLMQIECEPIPSGITGIVSTISISKIELNRLGLVHFIHATQAARFRVAEILGVAPANG
jgi:hypothetical protein